MSAATAQMEIRNALGMHARAATKFVQTANRYACEVAVTRDGQTVNGKSIMGMLLLAAAKGTYIEVLCTGEQAKEALAALQALVEDRFGEGG